jgi:hypothetical protein
MLISLLTNPGAHHPTTPIRHPKHFKLVRGGNMVRNREEQAGSQSNEAAPDELGNDPRQVGSASAGQSGDSQRLSVTDDMDNESVEELADSDQALEAARVDGLEDAADHPERPVHTHNEYGRPDDLPPARTADRKKAS